MTKKDQEKRAHPRVPMMVKIVDLENSHEEQCYSREVSIGGLFLETKTKFPVGKDLQLTFQIPGVEQDLRVKARVVRAGLVGSPNVHGVGLQFVDMDAHSETLIANYVEKLESIRRKLSE